MPTVDIGTMSRVRSIDQENLGLILFNLGTNAIAAGTKRIRTSCGEVSATDSVNGPSTPREDCISQIFDPFSSRTQGRLRWGLTSVEAIVTAVSGQLEATSELGLTTTLVIMSAADDAETPYPNAVYAIAKGSIVLVDDDGVVRAVCAELMEAIGLTVYPFDSGLDAVDWIGTHVDIPDLALVDKHMAEIDGLETIAAIRAVVPDLPTILVSGYLTSEDLEQAIAQGARVLNKPFSVEELIVAIEVSIGVQAERER